MAGDVVLAWNGQDVIGPAELINLVAKTPTGSAASVIVFRDGQKLDFSVTVGMRPPLP
jgi:S1-C subfamily serine protease